MAGELIIRVEAAIVTQQSIFDVQHSRAIKVLFKQLLFFLAQEASCYVQRDAAVVYVYYTVIWLVFCH